MPGYGYAKRSQKEILKWKNMIELYFRKRQSLVGFILVMDIRRNWTIQEDQLLSWLQADSSETNLSDTVLSGSKKKKDYQKS